MSRMLALTLLNDRLAIFRLPPDAPIPAQLSNISGFISITRTVHELSVVCAQDALVNYEKCEKGWRAFEVEGPLDFSLTGILSGITTSLADAGVGIFAISTHDTDYILVKEENRHKAKHALVAAGYAVNGT